MKGRIDCERARIGLEGPGRVTSEQVSVRKTVMRIWFARRKRDKGLKLADGLGIAPGMEQRVAVDVMRVGRAWQDGDAG